MWSSVTPPGGSVHGSPTTRSKHAMCTTSSGHIYLMGGRAGNRLLKDLWRFDPGNNLWEEVECRGPSPPSLQEHSMVAWDNKLYIFGGEVGISSNGDTTPLWILDLCSLTWQRTNSSGQSLGSTKTSPLGRRAHSCVLYGDAMHIFGGYQDLLGSSAELWTFDLGTEQWHLMSCPGRYSSQPCGRHSHSAIVEGEFMWIFGGMTGLKEKNDLWKWNFITRQWTKVKTNKGPAGLHGHSAIKSFGSMYIFGGERDGHLLPDLWSFNFATSTWKKIVTEGILPNPTSKHTSVANPFIEAEVSMSTSCSLDSKFNIEANNGGSSINHRHSVSLHHIHHQLDCNHHGDIKEQEEYEEESINVEKGEETNSSPETPDFELEKLVLDSHANAVRRRRTRPKSELVSFPSPDDTTDDLTYSEDMEWPNLKRHTVHESMSYYSLCFPSPQLSARLQAEGIRVPTSNTEQQPSLINGGTNGFSTFGHGTNGHFVMPNNPIPFLPHPPPPIPPPPSSMRTSLTSSGFSEAVSSSCDNDTSNNRRHRLSNSSSVSFNTDSMKSSMSTSAAQQPSSSMSTQVLPPRPFLRNSRSFDRPILRNHHHRTIMTPGSVENKPWHPQINAIREVVVPNSPALTSKWSSYSPAKSNARQWKLCMYVFGGREEGMSFIYKRPMSIWKLYI